MSTSHCPELPRLRGLSLLALLSIALGVGCAGPVSKSDVEGGARPEATLTPWQARGKMALSTREQRESVNFNWQRLSLDKEVLTLTGPIGMGGVQITRTGSDVIWDDGDGEVPLADVEDVSDEASRLLQTLPFDQLGGWLMGAAEPTEDWSTTVNSWQRAGAWSVPRKLTLQGAGVNAGVSVLVVILDWNLPESTAARAQ
ncbi:outer membrane lipoprotein LolB [Luminiphilus syltensis]|uniref:outer membrane lipoprotein LolB n=1 Tax=Luminiphilus syltensis TaxID=1341119 RepID=UPI0018A854BD|nr:outer membrane lipoprotein LolB [Luminiphilus syltensis]